MKENDYPVNRTDEKKEVAEEKQIKREERERSDKGGYHDRTINTDKSANK